MEHLKKHGHGDEGFPKQNIYRDMVQPWATKVPPVTASHKVDIADIEFQIHCIETEAYSAVLRAFTAQSDVLSWDKEALISNLRKELRVSDIEHRELLVKVDSDNSVRMIREWRKGTTSQREIRSDIVTPSVPGSMGHTSNKRRKSSYATTSSPLNCLPCAQPALGAIPSSLASLNKVATSFRFSTVGNGKTLKSIGHNVQTSLLSKGVPAIVPPRKGLQAPDITNFKRSSDIIEIRVTDRLIHEVERVINGENLDPVQVENAKLVLREHERAILEALEKLGDVSDDDAPNNCWYFHQE